MNSGSGSNPITPVLGATSAVAGIAALPNTGTNRALWLLSITAIAGGAIALVLQITVALYRSSSRR